MHVESTKQKQLGCKKVQGCDIKNQQIKALTISSPRSQSVMLSSDIN